METATTREPGATIPDEVLLPLVEALCRDLSEPFDFAAAERSYREFMETDYDPDPLRRYVRAHGGHCSGGGGCS